MDEVLNVLLMLAVGALLLVLLGITVRACTADAHRRGKSPVLVCVAVILFFPWGLIAWLLFRPDHTDGAGGQSRFRLQNHRVQ
jgi:hypothetical protein